MILVPLLCAFAIITCISLCGDFNAMINALGEHIERKWLRVTVKVVLKTIFFTFFICGTIATIFFTLVLNSSSSKDKDKN